MTVYTYIRRTPDLAVEDKLNFGKFQLRVFPRQEAIYLQGKLARRNVFARHAKNADVYAKRAAEFAEQSVLCRIEYDAATSAESIRQEATCVESLILVSRCFAERRETLHRSICASVNTHAGADLWVAFSAQQVSRKTSPLAADKPVKITRTDASRFVKLGFGTLVTSLPGNNMFLWDRACRVVDWLLLSRLDPNAGSAFIKTGTSAESLVAGYEQGQVTKRLSVRFALLTARSVAEFDKIRTLAAELYGLRCDFTHGRTRGGVSDAEKKKLEAFDRLTTLGLSSLAANGSHLATPQDVDSWFKSMGSTPSVIHPFPPHYVEDLLKLVL